MTTSDESIAPDAELTGQGNAENASGQEAQVPAKPLHRRKVRITIGAAEIHEWLSWAISTSCRRTQRRDALKRLLVAAHSNWPMLDSTLRMAVISAEGAELEVLRWIACELALDAKTIERSGGASSSMIDLQAPADRIMVLVAQSGWISTKMPLRSASTARRGLPLEVPDATGLLAHALFATDANALWPSEDSTTLVEESLVTINMSLIDDMAALDAPIARELMTRRDIIAFRERGDSMTAKIVRTHRYGRKVLERVLTSAAGAWGNVPNEMSRYRASARLARYVGRRFEVWGTLDKARSVVTSTAPSVKVDAARWAEFVALTHSRTAKAMKAVGAVPDVALAALLDAALRHGLRGLQEAAQDAVMARINRREATDDLWDGLLSLLNKAPSIERWLQAYVLPHAPIDSMTEQLNAGSVLSHAKVAPIANFVAPHYLTALTHDPALRVGVLAIAVRRLRDGVPQQQADALAATVTAVTQKLSEIESIRQGVRDDIGTESPRVEDAIGQCEYIVHDAVEAIRSQGVLAISKSVVAECVASPEPSITDVAAELKSLAFDPSRSREAFDRQRAALQRRLGWDAFNDPPSVRRLQLGLGDFPPEAYGAVWEAGVLLNAALLLESVEVLLPREPWARNVWSGVLDRTATELREELALSHPALRATCELLEQQLTEERTRFASPPLGADVVKEIDRAETAMAEMRAAVARIGQSLVRRATPRSEL